MREPRQIRGEILIDFEYQMESYILIHDSWEGCDI